MKRIKGFLIGNNLSNSFSKDIYTSISNKIDYKNVNIVNENELFNYISKKKYNYLNITTPYKKIVRELLDYESEFVKQTGVCNLIVNENGCLKGYNTDVFGFGNMICKHKIDIKDKKVLILGNGATSNTVSYVCKCFGAKSIQFGCREIKNIYKNEVLFDNVNKDAEIIVNTTPVGTGNDNNRLINLNNFPKLEIFIDVVYYPHKTTMMLDALELGKGAISGYDMLFYQAKQAYNIVTKSVIPSIVWDELRKDLYLKRLNLVFIGLPASGKTKTGKEIDRILNGSINKLFIDTDKEIENNKKCSIPNIFKLEGEEGFRSAEKNVVKNLYNINGCVISTGGGTILDKENCRILKRNGFFIYLKRTDFNNYIDDKKRPLVKNKEDLDRLYKERNPIYESNADLTISWEEEPNKILEEVCDAIFNY